MPKRARDEPMTLRLAGRVEIDAAGVLTCADGRATWRGRELHIEGEETGHGQSFMNGVRVLGRVSAMNFGINGPMVNGVPLAVHNAREQRRLAAHTPTPVRVELAGRRIDEITLSGSSSLHVASAEAAPKRLRARLSGSGDIVAELPALPDELDLSVSGSGDIVVRVLPHPTVALPPPIKT